MINLSLALPPTIVPSSASQLNFTNLPFLPANRQISDGWIDQATIESLAKADIWVDAREAFFNTTGTIRALTGDSVASARDNVANRLWVQSNVSTRPILETTPALTGGFNRTLSATTVLAVTRKLLICTLFGIVEAEVQIVNSMSVVNTLSTVHWIAGNFTAADVGRIKAFAIAEGARDSKFTDYVNLNNFFRAQVRIVTLSLNDWNVSSISSFTNFVLGCTALQTLDVASWNVSNAVGFSSFASGCTALQTLNVSTWDVSKVTGFSNFVNSCSSLAVLDVSNWNTISVTTFAGFAQGCTSLTTLNVTNWNTSNVTSFLTFARLTGISSLNLSNWNTSKVTNFSLFADICPNLTTVILTGGTGNPFADSPCTNYTAAFTSTNLTQASINGILVAINTAGTSNGTFSQSGGNAPSATGQAAITSLRSRGWAVIVTGGF